MIRVEWSQIKEFLDKRGLAAQYVDFGDSYLIACSDGAFDLQALIIKSDPISSDQSDFETNYKLESNQSPCNNVTTQYEKNDKDLKLAKIKALVKQVVISDITINQAQVRLKIPGTFGDPNGGRWIAGGDGWTDTFDPDDYIKVDCYDDDRLLAAIYGQQSGAGRSLTDQEMQAQGDYPQYPLLKSYTDTDFAEDNQGWYFWPLAQGNNLLPMGETEFEPIAGYGHIMGGLFLVMTLIRPNQKTGTLRGNIFWGKRG